MKNIIFLLSLCTFLFLSCQTTSVTSSTTEDGFTTIYDDVRNITFITHEDMETGFIYNLKDSLSGERENIKLYIMDKSLVAWADYQNSDWIFINGIVFLDSEGNRLALDYGNKTDSNVNTGAIHNVYVRESYAVTIKDTDVENLEKILNSPKIYVAFLGKKSTGKMELKTKYVSAMKLTIDKWKSSTK